MLRVCGGLFAILILTGLGSWPARAAGEEVFTDGIRFETGSSWKQVLSKAKLEHKYIFVDCYATWCGPCKKMDNEVYSNVEVGTKFNDHFISVKVQMDSSAKDNDEKRAFYADAHYIGSHYKVVAYPTLLFFNSDGKILRQSIGAMSAQQFIELAGEVLDPRRDYYAILENYKEGKRDIGEMSYLARTAEGLLGDTVQANEIARSYMLSLRVDDWYTKDNIEFMRQFISSSKDKGFSFFYKFADSIDKVMGDRTYAQGVVGSIIYREIVFPVMRTANNNKTEPDWTRMDKIIANQYNDFYAKRTITSARSNWGFRHKDWKAYTKYLVAFVENFGPEKDTGGIWEALYYNNQAWYIFQYSADTSELQIALKWSRNAVLMDPNPGWMDTYANILYKLNRREAAIRWQTVAATLASTNPNITEGLRKMKEGKPTWPSGL